MLKATLKKGVSHLTRYKHSTLVQAPGIIINVLFPDRFVIKYYNGASQHLCYSSRGCTEVVLAFQDRTGSMISILLSQRHWAKMLAVCTHKCKHTLISNHFPLLLALRSCQHILKIRMLSASASSGDTSTVRCSTSKKNPKPTFHDTILHQRSYSTQLMLVDSKHNHHV